MNATELWLTFPIFLGYYHFLLLRVVVIFEVT